MGALLTTPSSLLTTVRRWRLSVKVALTFWLFPLGTKLHEEIVADGQGLPNPSKCEPVAGAAVRVIRLASNIGVEHIVPQLMPGPPTVPLPLPCLTTLTNVRA